MVLSLCYNCAWNTPLLLINKRIPRVTPPVTDRVYMSLLKRLSDLFTTQPKTQDISGYWISVKCNRCGEVIKTRINLYNDLSADYRNNDTTYFCRKLVIGNGHCYQQIEINMTFDSRRHLIDRQVQGGQFEDENG
jgi:hypothetical protein